MKDLIMIRIEELVQEINNLLAHRDNLSSQMNQLNADITAKKGAIFELKQLIEISESSLQVEELNQEKS